MSFLFVQLANIFFLFVFIAVDLKNLTVYEGALKEGKADVTVTISDTDLLELAAGSISPQVAYMKGKLKLAGNIMLAQKLGPLMDANKHRAKL